jgi:hypothetical protein
MRLVNAMGGKITNVVVSGGSGASGGQAVAPRKGGARKKD